MSGGADRRLGYQCGDRSIRDSGDGYVVDVPARSSDFFIGTDAEPDHHILVRVSSAEIQRDIGEVRPSGDAIDERRPVAADRSIRERIRRAVVRTRTDVGPRRAAVGADLDDATIPTGRLE